MFGPNKISKSLIDAVLQVTENKTVDQDPQLLDEAQSEKVPTASGMKVYGHRYGDSAKARRDQTKHDVDKIKGPKAKEMKEEEELQEDGDCVSKPEAKKIAKKEVGHHNATMHKGQKDTTKNEDVEVKSFKDRLLERSMTDSETKKKEKIVMSMKDKQSYFKKKYGKRWKEVMYATATKKAMNETMVEEEEQDLQKFEELQQEAVKKSDVPAFLRKLRGDKPLTVKDVKGAPKDSISHPDNLAKARNEEVEQVEEDVATNQSKSSDKITTDMLSGRVTGGKLNSFKNFKVNLVTNGEENVPKQIDQGEDTKEKQKITTSPGAVDVKLDDKLTTPPQKYFSSQQSVTSEEVRGELKHIRTKEKTIRNKEVGEFTGKTKTSLKQEDIEEAKDPHMDAGVGSQPDFATEKVIAGVDGWKKVTKNVKDKSGAVHTPMSRAKDLARQAFKKVKNEMLGKAPGNN